jgi:hypothetical protein
VLQARFGTTLTPDVIPVRLDGFRRQWKGKVLSADPRHFVFQMQTPTSFWQRWIGRQPGLEVHIRLGSPPRGTTEGVPAATEVHVDIRPLGGQRESKAELLEVIGPLLVESVRGYLQVNPRGRQEERLVWQHPLEVCAVLPDGSLGPPVECHGKDISLNGIGFYLPGELPGSEVLLHLPQTPQTPKLSVRARVVRAQGCGDDWYEVGAILLHD